MSEVRMTRINKVLIAGRLTRDVEMRYIPSGTAIAGLSIAFNRSYKKDGEWQEEVGYINITVWGKLAERCAEKLHKGSPITVLNGYLRMNQYKDKDGNDRKTIEIVANEIEFLEKQQSTLTKNDVDNYQPPSVNQPTSNITDDDVPF